MWKAKNSNFGRHLKLIYLLLKRKSNICSYDSKSTVSYEINYDWWLLSRNRNFKNCSFDAMTSKSNLSNYRPVETPPRESKFIAESRSFLTSPLLCIQNCFVLIGANKQWITKSLSLFIICPARGATLLISCTRSTRQTHTHASISKSDNHVRQRITCHACIYLCVCAKLMQGTRVGVRKVNPVTWTFVHPFKPPVQTHEWRVPGLMTNALLHSL